MTENKDTRAAFVELIERTWRDPAFKRRLLAEPKAVFAEAGVPVPAGKTIKVLEETDTLGYFILPPAPDKDSLTDAQLEAVAGASGHLTCTPNIKQY
jgi:Nitrile hydratase, alpha chain